MTSKNIRATVYYRYHDCHKDYESAKSRCAAGYRPSNYAALRSLGSNVPTHWLYFRNVLTLRLSGGFSP